MKKILTIAFASLLAVATTAQQTIIDNNGTHTVNKTVGRIVIPGPGRIDVEQLNRNIDTDMDISQLTLSELRVLRNAFAARQGYPFVSSELRCLFSATSWYDDIFWKRSSELTKG